ncbi:Cof-type HAD-IIB family hydrolase [Ligilactobacillus pobuzihii]|uniref:HAD superfamily hydrolase n=1 Tax=Ligilactobacillus pobuzihii TaxID=449659 RepID=A0A0R2LID3_9LACO|nr:Cof-type HAD-IIB family hydrolase [Ligilactobacillus pobuzihii]KRK08952.1 HAD superfamily hydrolase [Ligilactobacillus pobuzihii E100301 = KCTC 13174]KRN98445.1 HAD superfamily hydrolase [Ligilactobacillus pobuzihii]GEN49317.1 hydrolase [Ligilactobacillus pobuzihii]
MAIKLIALDIDDTLLNSHGKIQDSTKKSLHSALQKGLKVVLCSGRPLPVVTPFLEELGITGDKQYAITYNGSVVESVTGNIVVQMGLDNQEYRHIDKYAQRNNLQYNVLDQNGTIYTSNRDVNRITVVQAWENNAGILIRTPDDLSSDLSIVKVVFVGETEKLDQVEPEVQAEFGQKNYVVRAADNFLKVMNLKANKGNALSQLTRVLGIDPSEVLVFGDERNDVPMFDFAGQAVAMGNGSKAAKEHASFVTASNNNDGIAKALTKFLELEE